MTTYVEEKELSIEEIYNQLMLGKKIVMQFSSEPEARTWLRALQNYKYEQVRIAKAYEMDALVKLSSAIEAVDDTSDSEFVLIMKMEKMAKTKFKVVVITELATNEPTQPTS
jgi:hypothetical protein